MAISTMAEISEKWENTFAVGVGAYISKNIKKYYPHHSTGQSYKVLTAGSLNYYKFSVIQIFNIYDRDRVIETIYAKAHRDPKFPELQDSVLADNAMSLGRAEFEFHRYSYERFNELSDEYAVVKPLDYIPDFNAILMERAEGQSLARFINSLASNKSQNVENQLYRCGKWLALLHNQFETNADKPFVPNDYLQLLERNLSKLDRQLNEHKYLMQIREKVQGIATAFEGRPEKQARTHGDYKARHIFLSERKITVIDFGNDLSAISPFMDVAAFLVEIESLGFATFRGHYKKWQPVLRAAFLDGYFSGSDEDWTLNMYMIYYWVKKWSRRRNKLTHSPLLRLLFIPAKHLHLLPLIHKWYTDPWFASKINPLLDALNEQARAMTTTRVNS